MTPPPMEAPSGVSSGAGTPFPSSHVFGFASTNPDPDKRHATPYPGPSSGGDADDLRIAPRTDVRGYAIERELGRGGMGTVYLATQLSLDRPVALKVMSKRWANDPVFVARFTREAFAAAQLSHPNIVQIHDIGEVDGARFFSMEYVRGKSLADLLKVQGKLDPETAVGYTLQAARGLKHAHDRGMIHRDVKPDNLLLDTQGLVKVADLGLVKTPAVSRADDRLADASSRSGLLSLPPDMTGARIALGTPAYMSPEQCRDAATVDHRADIYSLGCTLYVLVTGRPPFDGTTAIELMSKHAYDPLVPPEQIVARVPKEVSAVIQRMMAKSRDDRYQDMSEVIRTLEAWLGVYHAGTFSPQEDQISRLETSVLRFNTCGTAVLRGRLISGFFGTIALVAVLLAFFGKIGWAFGTFGLALEATLAYFLLDGITRKGHLFSCTRRFIAGLGRGDWIVGLSGFAMFCVLLALLKVLWIWIGFGLIGVGIAFALRYGMDRALAEERREIVDGCERQLRRMRARGLDEEELRQFVAKFAGRDWEEFFEALFGYEAKLAARAVLLRGGAAGVREKHAAWREPVLATMERIEKTRKEARERKLLLAVERANLLAAGASAQTAEDQASAAADAMVRAAHEIRRAETASGGAAAHAPASVRTLFRAAEQPDDFVFVPTRKRDPIGAVIALFVGPHIRAIGAAVLLAACALWAQQNGLLPGAELHAQATQAVDSQDLSVLQQPVALDANRATRPLALPGVPAPALAWVDGFNVGLAGLMMLASLFFRGNLMSVLVLIGAGVAAAGHQFGIHTVPPFRDYHVSLMLGSLLTLVGFRLGTR
ncbi:protein kinase [Gemmata sp. G18]|uniref:Protein kinase n=1 Tax=Gemmata palustris TaxID=2822762 RepID=A0ABS5BLP2_9BACT|nr:serine/threonine-protein kinase [Gemmata palustris]MBP3954629.1 protein kinase [Gemmata palustris]